MEFEWDEAKREETYRKHGIDLLEAALIFENDVLENKTREGITAKSALSPWVWRTVRSTRLFIIGEATSTA